MTKVSQRPRNILIYLCLTLVTAAVYWPVYHFEFSNLDDPLYVTENRHVQGGLTRKGLVWAFTTPLDQWMPVTWSARILERQLFDSNAGAHHLVNVLFHVVNTLLLFSVLKRMTRAPWRSALVAALFAVHPLNVESVAWVTGLKDVLSTCFWLLTIWAYVRYVEQLNVQRSTSNVQHSALSALRSPLSAFYALTLLFFALGLMAKPMVVTLPFVLLLLDYWPLGRTPWAKPATIRSEPATGESVETPPSRLLKEKLPFLALAAASCVVTLWAQRGAVNSLEKLPAGARAANVVVSYMRYIGKAFWPSGLAAFYPYQGWSSWAVMGAGAMLVGISCGVLWRAQRKPHLAVGWLWYLGTLVPVIGLVQVGEQSLADRYAYLPLVGLFVMLCWSVPCRAIEQRLLRAITCIAVGTVLAVCAMLARIQLGYWKNSETLFRHALNVTRDNWLAHNNLGFFLSHSGRIEEAIAHYEQALRIEPALSEAHYNLGLALSREGRFEEATGQFEQALRINPDMAEAHSDLAIALVRLGEVPEAVAHWKEALRLRPDFADACYSLGLAFLGQGQVPEAMERFGQTLRINPNYAEAYYNVGLILSRAGYLKEAISQFEHAVRINPDLAEAQNNLAVALVQLGRLPEAAEHFEQVVRVKPGDAQTHYNLGNVLVQLDRVQEAMLQWQQAVQINPDLAEAHNNLGLALCQAGELPEAIAHFEQALRVKPDDAATHYNLGVALERAGKLNEAIQHFEQAVRLRPDFAEAQSKLTRLRGAQ